MAVAERLRALVPELRDASVRTAQSELERMVGRAEERGDALMMALMYLLGLAASVGLLLLLLGLELKRNGRLVAAAKEAEVAARLSEQRFRDILECSTDWVWETDREHRFSMLTGSQLEHSGEPPRDVLGKSRFERRLDDDADDANWQWHGQVLKQRLPFRDFIYPYRNALGETRWARVHGRPLFDLKGGFLGYRGTGRDITEEIEQERALKESRSLLHSVIDAVPAVINLKDRDSRYVFMNRFQGEVYGVEPDKAIGRTSAELIGDDYGEESRMLDLEVLRSGAPQAFRERPFVDAAGRRRTWWTAKQPLKDDDGNVRHVVTVALDITDLKESERLRQNLSRYFSPNMVDLLAARDEPIGQVREQQVAVVFADIFDFTHYAASATPAAVMATLARPPCADDRHRAGARRHAGEVPGRRADGDLRHAGTERPGRRQRARRRHRHGELRARLERRAQGPRRAAVAHRHRGALRLGDPGRDRQHATGRVRRRRRHGEPGQSARGADPTARDRRGDQPRAGRGGRRRSADGRRTARPLRAHRAPGHRGLRRARAGQRPRPRKAGQQAGARGGGGDPRLPHASESGAGIP
jgi:PAS domain S-box-containing protein